MILQLLLFFFPKKFPINYFLHDKEAHNPQDMVGWPFSSNFINNTIAAQ